MIVGAYSSVFIAPAILAQLREKEPAMMALAKRVNARGGVAATADSVVAASSPTVAVSAANRGPRNQPKRKNRK
jgi:preprotein translocase subunit SecF